MSRLETFVRGRGRYLADVPAPGALHVAFVRSPHAHARIDAIDVSAAVAAPGVRAVLTGADLGDVEPLGYVWNPPGQRATGVRCLAEGRVRYFGQPVAAVVADDGYLAEDAVDLVRVGYTTLPPVVGVDAALAGAVRVHEDWPDNTLARMDFETGDVDAALEAADVCVEDVFSSSRVHGLPLEGHGVLAVPEPDGTLCVHTSTQSVHQVRSAIADALHLPMSRVRVICPDVGGAFGVKAVVSDEEVLVALLAVRLGRAVRWVEDRNEALLVGGHGRNVRVELKAGFRADGTILGIRARVLVDTGATPTGTGIGPGAATGAFLVGPYRVADALIEVVGLVTTTPPVRAYRGFGQPEGVFAMERVLDIAAARLGLDPVVIRSRNLLRPDELPYWTASMMCLDSGDYPAMLEQVSARLAGAAEEETPPEDGWRRGTGLACYTEVTNFGPSTVVAMMGIEEPGHDSARVRMNPDGGVQVFTSQIPMGQGIDTALARVAADALGVEPAAVVVHTGDTERTPYTGYGSGGSRGAGTGGSTVFAAASEIAEKLIRIGAHLLDVSPADVNLAEGRLRTTDSSRELPLAEVAGAAWRGLDLPKGETPELETTATYEPQGFGFSYGAVGAVVDVDVETGEVLVRRLVFGHDCGPQLDPDAVAGQVIGGAVQGLGTALYEHLDYDADGLPAVRNMGDYVLPTAAVVPEIELLHTETPSPFSLNGAKGVGEAGTIPVPAAIVNAVQAALPPSAPALRALPLRRADTLAAFDSAGEIAHAASRPRGDMPCD